MHMTASTVSPRRARWAVFCLPLLGCSSGAISTAPTAVVDLRDAGRDPLDAGVTTQVDGMIEGAAIAEAGAISEDGETSEASETVTDASVSTADAVADAMDVQGDGPSTEEAASQSGVQTGPMSSTQALVRIANWVPDSPATGYDVCLAPAGTTSWVGPLLEQNFDAGALGEGGPNGIQFPDATAYVAVSAGQYDLQLVVPGTGCSTGVIGATSGLPYLSAGSATTFAVTGTIIQLDNDSPMKISPFSDETAGIAGGALVRFVNADPTVAAAVLGTGDLASGNFVSLFPDGAFAVAAKTLADGGVADPNGYALISPLSGQELSAHATGGSADLATAAHATAAAGTVTTLILINGADEGSTAVTPPQLMACIDSAAPSGALSQCTVLISE